MASALYVDTSAALRATLESARAVARSMDRAEILVTSRLALVESARALHRMRLTAQVPEQQLADVGRSLDLLWSRCVVWELSRAVCELAATVAPQLPLRALDAMHLATFVLARRRFEGLVLLTMDERLRDAATRA